MVDEFAIFIETVHFHPTQCVGTDGMVFVVVERPFFAEVVATFEHFAVASVNDGQIAVAKIDFGKQQPCAAVGGTRFSRGRLKNINRMRTFRTYPTSGMKVLCGLLLARPNLRLLLVLHKLMSNIKRLNI